MACVRESDMGVAEMTTFLTYLAVERRVAASTQNQHGPVGQGSKPAVTDVYEAARLADFTFYPTDHYPRRSGSVRGRGST
jgi:hypothetical protein